MKASTSRLLLAIIVLVTSCTNVYYEAPQPAGQANLTEFPKKLVGLYTDVREGDTAVIIYSDGFSLDANKNDVKIPLSEKAILRKYQSYYFLNIQQEDSLWQVFIVKPGKKKTVDLYDFSTEEEPMKKLGAITEVMKKVKPGEEQAKMYINPNLEEMDSILKSGLLIPVKTIKKQ